MVYSCIISHQQFKYNQLKLIRHCREDTNYKLATAGSKEIGSVCFNDQRRCGSSSFLLAAHFSLLFTLAIGMDFREKKRTLLGAGKVRIDKYKFKEGPRSNCLFGPFVSKNLQSQSRMERGWMRVTPSLTGRSIIHIRRKNFG